MATNTPNTPTARRYSAGWDAGRRMRAFDNFPATVRRALANAASDYSIEQCHLMLHGGDPVRKIPPKTPDQIVRLIEFNDTRVRNRA
jgi:hypothetical protein